jgi:UDP-N-acetylglucosamine diphosphorylase / glucose-1-phosphate thymidylyltransferase / UDP-N-acetylgalactosamine diphosphorylase / glucosamine-1-phosphate N-acetyltransferase / galactosamine-1-phosphate N-acetyltransferase
VKALILCGGVGNRFQPLRDDKFLLDFLGKPLVLHIVEMLRDAGIEQFIFAGNGANEVKLRQLCRSLDDLPCQVVVQEVGTGMAGAVEAAGELLDGPVLIVSSNDVVEPQAYRKLVEAAEGGGCDVALVACKTGSYFPGGYLVTDAEMRVSHIVEKPGAGSEPSDMVNVVVHYHREPLKLLEALLRVQTEKDDRYEVALDLMMREGRRVVAVPYVGFWGPLKYPWDVLPVMEHFVWGVQRRVSMGARIAGSAVIEGTVVVAEGARVLEHAVVRGPAYIGEKAIIGNNVLIRGGSHIGAGSVVGFSTEVKHCYIGRNCWFHSNYVGDSIIDDRCSFGSGAVTANLRFDEGIVSVRVGEARLPTGMDKLGVIMGQGSQVGINASLMPGVLVGPGAVVGPHVCLMENLPPGHRALSKAGYVIENLGDMAAGSSREEMRRKLDKV